MAMKKENNNLVYEGKIIARDIFSGSERYDRCLLKDFEEIEDKILNLIRYKGAVSHIDTGRGGGGRVFASEQLLEACLWIRAANLKGMSRIESVIDQITFSIENRKSSRTVMGSTFNKGSNPNGCAKATINIAYY